MGEFFTRLSDWQAMFCQTHRIICIRRRSDAFLFHIPVCAKPFDGVGERLFRRRLRQLQHTDRPGRLNHILYLAMRTPASGARGGLPVKEKSFRPRRRRQCDSIWNFSFRRGHAEISSSTAIVSCIVQLPSLLPECSVHQYHPFPPQECAGGHIAT